MLDEQRSFCYWDTRYKADMALYDATGVNHFYIRYFDVDWDPLLEEARPVASLSMPSYIDSSISLRFTPSVFLTNKVFEKSSNEALKTLSTRIKKRIDEMTESFGDMIVNDILIDCDWTAGTKEKFFYFIKRLQSDFPDKDITVTLRLWQYKQNKPSDIPPVDRCLLMCYNMQTVNDYNVENSIASLNELKKFVSGKKYPLALDVALPVFNWAVLFRNEQFVGLLGNVNKKEYANNLIEYEELGNGRYRSLVDKVVGDFFMRKGDIVRVEEVSKEELRQMADYLQSEIPMDLYPRVSFFSWNQSYINNYGTDEIKNIYTVFSK